MNSRPDFNKLSKDEFEVWLSDYITSAKADPLYEEDRDFRIRIIQLENCLNDFSGLRAKEITEKLLLEIEMDANRKRIENIYHNLRQPVISELKKDPTNEVLKKTAHQIMEMEKKDGVFNPDNWKELPG